jgi:hypothetical protein
MEIIRFVHLVRERLYVYRRTEKFVESEGTYPRNFHTHPKYVECAHHSFCKIVCSFAPILTVEYHSGGVGIACYYPSTTVLFRPRRRQLDAFKTDPGRTR